jgi:hypothetical protein
MIKKLLLHLYIWINDKYYLHITFLELTRIHLIKIPFFLKITNRLFVSNDVHCTTKNSSFISVISDKNEKYKAPYMFHHLSSQKANVPPFMNSYKAHKTMPITVSLTKLLTRPSIQPLEAPSFEFFPARSRNLKFPVSANSAYITPFMWPFPITPTTLLQLFTALLRFRDHARYCRTSKKYYCLLGSCSLVGLVTRKRILRCNF